MSEQDARQFCPRCGGAVLPAWPGSTFWFRCQVCDRLHTQADLRAAPHDPSPADPLRASGSPGLFDREEPS